MTSRYNVMKSGTLLGVQVLDEAMGDPATSDRARGGAGPIMFVLAPTYRVAPSKA